MRRDQSNPLTTPGTWLHHHGPGESNLTNCARADQVPQQDLEGKIQSEIAHGLSLAPALYYSWCSLLPPKKEGLAFRSSSLTIDTDGCLPYPAPHSAARARPE